MNILRYILLITILMLSSCSITKHIPSNESLYTGAKIKIIADSTISKKQTQLIDEQIVSIIRPLPNSTFFGFPYKVWLYYVLGEPRKTKSPRRWFRNRFGEAPIFASKRAVNTNTEIISNFLNNEGYFRSTATGELLTKGKTSQAIYTAYLKPRYTINEVKFINKDSSFFSKNLLQTQENSLLKINEPYRFDNIKSERERIDRNLKQKGFYFFRPDYLIVKADTSLKNRKVNLSLELKPNTIQTALKQYHIKDILVYVDAADSSIFQQKAKRGIRIIDPNHAYKSRVFTDVIGFSADSLYDNRIHDASLSRLINLKNFKFVKNRFELVNRSDSALVNAIYELTSYKSKSLRTELSGLTKSNGLTGSKFELNWTNRNTFRGAEILRLGMNTGIDFQVGSKNNTNLNDYYRLSGEADLNFPRFILPFYSVNPAKNQALPKTNLNIGYDRLIQQGLYTLTSLRGAWGYNWRSNAEIEHSFTPFSINLIKPKNISEEFVNKIFSSNNPQDLLRYLKILENRLILGGQYNISYTPKQLLNSHHYFHLTAGVDIAGNIAGLFSKKSQDKETPKQLFGIPYEQYARFDVEIRYYHDFSPTVRLANRFILGYGLPYGNSTQLPSPIKQYFVGGSNSLRAFKARSLGPGGYNADSLTTAIFGNSSYGDVKLEANTELRIKFSQLINFAAFIDAGNIWIAKYDPNTSFYSEESEFSKNFYKQLAVGGGLGLRFDFSFVKLRFDFAIPFRKPWLPEKESWVFSQIDPFTKLWRKENLISNIAVDLPF